MAKRTSGGVLPGTVDLVILKAVAGGPIHGFGISRSLKERSGGVVELQDAALYQALHRLAKQGQVKAHWGLSESNRKARFYQLTARGRKQLEKEEHFFRTYVDGVFRILSPEPASA